MSENFTPSGGDNATKPLQIDEVAAADELRLQLHALQRQVEAQNAQLRQARQDLKWQVVQRAADLHEHSRHLREIVGEYKQKEDAMKVSETKYRAVFESANDGVFLHRIVDCNGSIDFILDDINPKGCELWRCCINRV